MERYLLLMMLLAGLQITWGETVQSDESDSNESYNFYNKGIEMGIIDPEKYPFESFLRDEKNFKELHQEFNKQNYTDPINYEEWLVFNNFGILPDTMESLFERKITKRSTEDNKRQFVNTVRKGDILISDRSSGGGLSGHAAIMTSDYWVLEMKGGSNWAAGIPNNNRQVSKYDWFDEHRSDWTTVYRCPNSDVARSAAVWADHTYYNPTGGAVKAKYVTYFVDSNMKSFNPSYDSKLILQAYYYGTGSRQVVSDLSKIGIVAPVTIPNFFLSPYRLQNKGRF